MINPLKIATSGYLKRTSKAALVIAISGYLNFSDVISASPQITHGAVSTEQPYKSKVQKKKLKRQIKVTVIRDGIEYTEYAYTSDLTVTVNNISIHEDNTKPSGISIIIHNVKLN